MNKKYPPAAIPSNYCHRKKKEDIKNTEIMYIIFRSIACLLVCVLIASGVDDALEASCRLSTSLIPDCHCRMESVHDSVNNFFAPVLLNLTTRYVLVAFLSICIFVSFPFMKLLPRPFFRYFYIDLDKPCPIWHEEGECMMEACSVCTCDESEVPKSWHEMYQQQSDVEQVVDEIEESGWITSNMSGYGFQGRGHDDSLGRLYFKSEIEQEKINNQISRG